VQSEVGLLSITGTDAAPAKVGISVADIAAGMYAYSGILTALLARATTGTGTVVDVSLFDALGEWMTQPVYYTGYGGAPPRRSGAEHASIAPYGPIRAADGELFVAVQNAREWARFCADVLRWPQLEHDDRFRTNALRVTNRNALHIVIESALGSLGVAELISRLETARVAYARMNSIAEYLQHPQLIERDVWRDVDSPAGALRAAKPPVRIDGVHPVMRAVPALGEHTDAILEELGVARATVAAWRAAGVI